MNTLEMLLWLNTIVAIVGTYLNAKQVRFGFIIWMITNAVFVVNNIVIGSFAQATLFGVYFFLAVYGWFSWGKQKVETKETSN
jgi:nicotinamide riboside transporter PnuC